MFFEIHNSFRMLYRTIFFSTLLVYVSVMNTTIIAAADTAGKKLKDPLKIQGGMISGSSLKEKIRTYKGIPFAAPPVDDLRWKPPQPVVSWKGIRKCIKYGPACVQTRVHVFFSKI